jgi:hypothetical protein
MWDPLARSISLSISSIFDPFPIRIKPSLTACRRLGRGGLEVNMMVVLSLTIFLTILVLLLVDLFCDHLRHRRLRTKAARLKLSALLLHRGQVGRENSGGARSALQARRRSTTRMTCSTRQHQGLSPFHPQVGVCRHVAKLEAAYCLTSLHSGLPTDSSTHSNGFVCISNPVYDRGGVAHRAKPRRPARTHCHARCSSRRHCHT